MKINATTTATVNQAYRNFMAAIDRLLVIKAKDIEIGVKMSHKTKEMIIKTASIDEEIIPVVEWLNKQQDVFTRWSCEGEQEPKNFNDRPMVVFYCESSAALVKILSKVRSYALVECEFYSLAGAIRYTIWFTDKQSLELFKENLSEQ